MGRGQQTRSQQRQIIPTFRYFYRKMETPRREYYCLDCIGIKDDDLCRACFKERYQPVKKTVENKIRNEIQNKMINKNEQENVVVDTIKTENKKVNQSNDGDMENLIKLSNLDFPMFSGLCIECEDFQGGNICKIAKANRILQWIENTYRYRKEREGKELYVTWTVLPDAMLNLNDDYSIDNLNEIDE